MKVDIKKMIDDKSYCEDLFKYFLKKEVIKEDEYKDFEKHLNKSLNNLAFGNFIFEEHNYSIKEKLPKKTFYDWCVTIYYYAIYHMALALLAKIGYASKNHLATIVTITLFYYHKDNILKKEEIEFFIEKINLEKEDINLVLDSKGLREKACYGTDESFELKIAKKLQIETVEFINKIKELLKE